MVDYAAKPVRESGTRIVQDYLDTLLSDVSALSDANTPAPQPQAPEPDTQTASAPDVPPDGSAADAVVADSRTRSKAAGAKLIIDKPPLLAGMAAHGNDVDPPASGVESWRDHEFASLLFDVNGLQMAAPLHHLGGISPLLLPLPSVAQQADWFMGLMRWNGRNIRVVDTARLIMPERPTTGSSDYQSVIVLGDSHWALAATAVSQSITLAPGDVRWHRGSVRRPWLSGMLIHRLCVLMDVERLIGMLDDAC